MKRSIHLLVLSLVLVVVLVLSQLATGTTGVLAGTTTVSLTPIGSNGYTGSATLTTTLKSDGVTKTTEVSITGLTDSSSTLISGKRTAAIYYGMCSGLTLPGTSSFEDLNDTFTGGASDTTGLRYYFTLLSPIEYTGPYYTYTIAIAGTDGHVAACVDVGMPSVSLPTPTVPPTIPAIMTITPIPPTIPSVPTMTLIPPVPTSTPTAIPQMPTTGNPDTGSMSSTVLLAVFGSLGLVMLILGLSLTRRASRWHVASRVRKE